MQNLYWVEIESNDGAQVLYSEMYTSHQEATAARMKLWNHPLVDTGQGRLREVRLETVFSEADRKKP